MEVKELIAVTNGEAKGMDCRGCTMSYVEVLFFMSLGGQMSQMNSTTANCATLSYIYAQL